MVAAPFAAVERKARRGEAGRLRGRRRRVELADQLPGAGVQGGVGARGARQRRLVDQHDLGEVLRAGDGRDRGRILRQVAAGGQEPLMDDLVE